MKVKEDLMEVEEVVGEVADEAADEVADEAARDLTEAEALILLIDTEKQEMMTCPGRQPLFH